MSDDMRSEDTGTDLRDFYELDDVRLYEVACRTDIGFKEDEATVTARTQAQKRKEEGKGEEEDQQWDISVKVSARRIECRARVFVMLRDCRYLVDAASIYRSDTQEGPPPQDLVVKFIEKEALPALLPFVRAEVHQGAAKIRGSRRVFKDLTLDGVLEAAASAAPAGD